MRVSKISKQISWVTLKREVTTLVLQTAMIESWIILGRTWLGGRREMMDLIFVIYTSSIGISTIIPEYLKLHFTGEDYRGFEAYENILSTSEDRLERMVYFFDFLASDKGVSYSKLLLNPWKNKEDQEEPSYPYMLDRKEISIQDHIALYALMLYIDTPSKECPEDLQRYESWMRIVWNLIAAPQLRTYQTQKHYMELLSKLAPYSREIESFLLKTDPQEIGIGGTDSGELIRRLKLEQEKLQYLKKLSHAYKDK